MLARRSAPPTRRLAAGLCLALLVGIPVPVAALRISQENSGLEELKNALGGSALMPERLDALTVHGVPVRRLLGQIPAELDAWLDRPVRVAWWVSDLDNTLRPSGQPMPQTVADLIHRLFLETAAQFTLATGSAVGARLSNGQAPLNDVGTVLTALEQGLTPSQRSRLRLLGAVGQQRVDYTTQGARRSRPAAPFQAFLPYQQAAIMRAWLREAVHAFIPSGEQGGWLARCEAIATPEAAEEVAHDLKSSLNMHDLRLIRWGVHPDTGQPDFRYAGILTLAFPADDSRSPALARAAARAFDSQIRPTLPDGVKPAVVADHYVSVTWYSKDEETLALYRDIQPLLSDGVVVMLGDHPDSDTFFRLSSKQLERPILKFLVDAGLRSAYPEMLPAAAQREQGGAEVLRTLLGAERSGRHYRAVPWFLGGDGRAFSIADVERATGYSWADLRAAAAGLEEDRTRLLLRYEFEGVTTRAAAIGQWEWFHRHVLDLVIEREAAPGEFRSAREAFDGRVAEDGLYEAVINMLEHGGGGILEMSRFEGPIGPGLIAKLIGRRGTIRDPNRLLAESVTAQAAARSQQQRWGVQEPFVHGLGFQATVLSADHTIIESDGQRWEITARPAARFRLMPGGSSVRQGVVWTLVYDMLPQGFSSDPLVTEPGLGGAHIAAASPDDLPALWALRGQVFGWERLVPTIMRRGRMGMPDPRVQDVEGLRGWLTPILDGRVPGAVLVARRGGAVVGYVIAEPRGSRRRQSVEISELVLAQGPRDLWVGTRLFAEAVAWVMRGRRPSAMIHVPVWNDLTKLFSFRSAQQGRAARLRLPAPLVQQQLAALLSHAPSTGAGLGEPLAVLKRALSACQRQGLLERTQWNSLNQMFQQVIRTMPSSKMQAQRLQFLDLLGDFLSRAAEHPETIHSAERGQRGAIHLRFDRGDATYVVSVTGRAVHQPVLGISIAQEQGPQGSAWKELGAIWIGFREGTAGATVMLADSAKANPWGKPSSVSRVWPSEDRMSAFIGEFHRLLIDPLLSPRTSPAPTPPPQNPAGLEEDAWLTGLADAAAVWQARGWLADAVARTALIDRFRQAMRHAGRAFPAARCPFRQECLKIFSAFMGQLARPEQFPALHVHQYPRANGDRSADVELVVDDTPYLVHLYGDVGGSPLLTATITNLDTRRVLGTARLGMDRYRKPKFRHLDIADSERDHHPWLHRWSLNATWKTPSQMRRFVQGLFDALPAGLEARPMTRPEMDETLTRWAASRFDHPKTALILGPSAITNEVRDFLLNPEIPKSFLRPIIVWTTSAELAMAFQARGIHATDMPGGVSRILAEEGPFMSTVGARLYMNREEFAALTSRGWVDVEPILAAPGQTALPPFLREIYKSLLRREPLSSEEELEANQLADAVARYL